MLLRVQPPSSVSTLLKTFNENLSDYDSLDCLVKCCCRLHFAHALCLTVTLHNVPIVHMSTCNTHYLYLFDFLFHSVLSNPLPHFLFGQVCNLCMPVAVLAHYYYHLRPVGWFIDTLVYGWFLHCQSFLGCGWCMELRCPFNLWWNHLFVGIPFTHPYPAYWSWWFHNFISACALCNCYCDVIVLSFVCKFESLVTWPQWTIH